MNELLKERIMSLMIREPKSLSAMAKSIGLDNVTFYSFWKGTKKTSLKNLIVIENFLKIEEKRLGID